MDIVLDLLSQFAADPVGSALFLFINGGWVLLLLMLLWLTIVIYSFYIQGKYIGSLKWHLLAIDIPIEEGVPHLKKVENFFATLLGAHGSITLVEKYLQGEVQQWFSLELVSIDGYIQYMIRTTEKFKDLVEAAIYAQWPNAEVTEVEDYTTKIPNDLPNEDWKLFGMEWINVMPEAYPLRTYRNFEHMMSQTFADPMGTVLETFARGRPGEQFWFQIIITPINESWKDEGRKIVKKLIGAPVKEEKTFIDKILSPLWQIMYGTAMELFALEPYEEKKSDPPPSQVIFLSPGEGEIVSAIEEKLSKIGYKCKLRFIYVARPDVFNKGRAANPMIGAIKQVNTMNMGALKPYNPSVTKVQYFFVNTRVKRRIRLILGNYKARSNGMGVPGLGFVLNIEELATLWHFPGEGFTTPPVSRVEAKKGTPPTTLPFEDSPIGPTVRRPSKPTAPERVPIEEPPEEPEAPEDLPGAGEAGEPPMAKEPPDQKEERTQDDLPFV